MSRTVETTLDDVLSMVSCQYDWGHSNQIAQHFFWTLVDEHVSDEEIEAFIFDRFLNENARANGYGDEDATQARDILHQWRDAHSKNETE
jgi:hypothetical protein